MMKYDNWEMKLEDDILTINDLDTGESYIFTKETLVNAILEANKQ